MFPLFDWLKRAKKPRDGEEYLRAAFDLSLEEARMYYGTTLNNPLASGNVSYPHVTNLDKWDLRAVSSCFQVSESDRDDAIRRITSGFTKLSEHLYRLADKDLCLNIRVWKEFEGTIVDLLTNDLAVFSRLTAGAHSPPPPWIVFPEMDPETLGSLQGNIDFWWWMYWDPFWKSMSEEKQDQYLKDMGASDAWAECIRDH